jgi:hypothetical protein
MSMQEPGLPEIKLETDSLYREEVFTDRRAGTVRRMIPVLPDGSTDASRPEIEAPDLATAIERFPEAVRRALEEAIEEAQQMRREAASRIVVPEGGAALGQSLGSKIKMP